MGKKTVIMALVLMAALGAFAKGHGGPGGHHGGPAPVMRGGPGGGMRPGGGHHGTFRAPPPPPPAPRHRHHHHHHHTGALLSGFVGGVVGGVLVDAITPSPVVVSTPAVVTPAPVGVGRRETVWVAGRYVDEIRPDGSVIRVWQPGHYETITVY